MQIESHCFYIRVKGKRSGAHWLLKRSLGEVVKFLIDARLEGYNNEIKQYLMQSPLEKITATCMFQKFADKYTKSHVN